MLPNVDLFNWSIPISENSEYNGDMNTDRNSWRHPLLSKVKPPTHSCSVPVPWAPFASSVWKCSFLLLSNTVMVSTFILAFDHESGSFQSFVSDHVSSSKVINTIFPSVHNVLDTFSSNLWARLLIKFIWPCGHHTAKSFSCCSFKISDKWCGVFLPH